MSHLKAPAAQGPRKRLARATVTAIGDSFPSARHHFSNLLQESLL